MVRRIALSLLAVLCTIVLVGAGCGKKSAAPEAPETGAVGNPDATIIAPEE